MGYEQKNTLPGAVSYSLTNFWVLRPDKSIVVPWGMDSTFTDHKSSQARKAIMHALD